MKYNKLLNSDLSLSEIGLGCASYWGKKHFSEKQALAVVYKAIDCGINYFDTGHSYSAGNAEFRLGKALCNTSNSNLVVSSKAGTKLGSFGKLLKDFSPQWIEQSCNASLQQLGLEHLPLFFLHGPNPEDFNEDTFAVLEKLVKAGKVGMVGVNSFDDHIIELTVSSKQFQCVMLDYNLFVPHRLQKIQYLKSNGMDVIVAGGLGGGFYRKGFGRITNMKQLWYWLRAIKNHRSKMGQASDFEFLNYQQIGSAIQIALAYVLQEPSISSTLVGTTVPKHLVELVEAAELELPAQLLQKIAAIHT